MRVSLKTEAVARYAGLAAEEHGRDGDRPPIVLLHGLSFDRTMWGSAIEELLALDANRRIVAFDLPGHGESSRRESYGFAEVVDQLRDAIDEADLAAPVLVGHSISSGLASIYAARHPTSGVVNVDGSLAVRPFAELVQSLRAGLEGGEFDALWRTIFWPSLRTDVLPLSAQELLRATSCPRKELVLGYWRDLLDRSPAEVEAWVGEGLAELRDQGVPYLIVAGEELDDHYRRWLASELPQATATVFPGSGHFPPLAHPRLFAECVLAFVRWSSAWSYVA
jgi:pimeloyl-ACP methyl ester carboxylesterase